MNRTFSCLFLALLLITTHTLGQQPTTEDTWSRYRPDKLSSIIKAHTNPAEQPNKGVDWGSDPVRARVIYTGISRPTLKAKQHFIAFYMESLGTPEAAKKFMTEMLFIEDGVKFWLPIQDVLLPYFKKELHKEESVVLFADWIGTIYPDQGGNRLHIFLVNEFEKPKVSQLSRLSDDQWVTLTGPDKDFTVGFPVEPKRDEFRNKHIPGKTGQLIRRYYTLIDTLMLAVSFQDLGYTPNHLFANRLARTYEQKVKDVAKKNGWKIVKVQRLSSSMAEVETWQRSDTLGGDIHLISRSVVRNGQAYDLQCRSLFIAQEVDRDVCRRFFNSFSVIGPPQ